MNEETMLERIRGGDAKAIASLMSRLLQPQGITVKVNRKDDLLIVLLEASYVPDPERMVPFIQTGMANLNVSSVARVYLYGKQADHAAPAWSRELVLHRPMATATGGVPQNAPTLPSTRQAPIHLRERRKEGAIASSPTSSSKATGVGQMLVTALWLRLGFDALFILYSLVWATYYVYYFLDIADTTGFWAYLINQLVQTIDRFFVPLERIANGIYWATALLMLIWLHRFHAKLQTLFNHYPISPWGAVARFAIPFYNFWGIWNVFTTLAHQLEHINPTRLRAGKELRRWLPIFYGSFIAANGLRQAYWGYLNSASPSELAIWLYVLRNGAALLLAIAWLKLVWVAIREVQHH